MKKFFIIGIVLLILIGLSLPNSDFLNSLIRGISHSSSGNMNNEDGQNPDTIVKENIGREDYNPDSRDWGGYPNTLLRQEDAAGIEKAIPPDSFQSGETSSPGSSSTEASPDSSPNSQSSNGYFMNLKELMAVENISISDKLSGLSILSKLSEKDRDRMIDIIQDGITLKEMEVVRGILKESLTGKEVKMLEEILERNRELYAAGKLTGD